jgi:hypothetical protein
MMMMSAVLIRVKRLIRLYTGPRHRKINEAEAEAALAASKENKLRRKEKRVHKGKADFVAELVNVLVLERWNNYPPEVLKAIEYELEIADVTDLVPNPIITGSSRR